MNQFNETLNTAIAYSYVEYIDSYFNLVNHSMFFSTEYLDKETALIQEHLKEKFLALPELLSASDEEKEQTIHDLLTLREQIEVKYRTLVAYQNELTLLLSVKQQNNEFISQYFNESSLSPASLEGIDFYQLATDCTHYLFDQTNQEERQKRAATLLPYLPIKITKDNYISYVNKSIRHIAISNNETSAHYLTSILGQLFNGSSFEGYGKHFVDLYDSLESLKAIEDFEALFEEADLLNETLENVMDMLSLMFHSICTFSILLTTHHMDFTELTNLHAAFFDLYYSIKNIVLDTEDKAMLISSLPERLEALQKELKEDYQKIPKNSGSSSPLLSLIQTYLSMNIRQIFGFSTAKHSAYDDKVLSIFSNFTASLKEQLCQLPTVEGKLRMQYFISQIPFIMSRENFDAYAHQAFTHIKYTALLSAHQLTGILEENHYFPSPKEEPVIETNEVEDDEAAQFLAAHSHLFKDEEPFSFLDTPEDH